MLSEKFSVISCSRETNDDFYCQKPENEIGCPGSCSYFLSLFSPFWLNPFLSPFLNHYFNIEKHNRVQVWHLSSTKYRKLGAAWLNESSRDESVAQGTCAKGFITEATASSDTTASESHSCSTWGGKEKCEHLEKHLSVRLISSSTSLLSPAGHEEKANGSRPELCHVKQVKKASELRSFIFKWAFHHSVVNV